MSQSLEKETYQSETPKHRDVLVQYCVGYGVDVGFGGDPVVPSAIRMDLPQPYAHTGHDSVQLGGNCRDLRWLASNQLDYLYSSHVMKDFPENETEPIMKEWARVLRPGGKLILLLPDQPTYAAHCEATGQRANEHHSIPHFSLAYVKEVAERVGGLKPVAEHPKLGDYSFAVVFEKLSETTGDSETDILQQLAEAWVEIDLLRGRARAAELRFEKLEKSKVFQAMRGASRIARTLMGKPPK